jgi:rhodanese-related sulfurtransferase
MAVLDFFKKDQDMNEGIKEFNSTPKAMLIDVRTKQEYKEKHVPRAHNFDVADIKNIETLVPKNDTPVFLYCASGSRASKACRAMQKMGYTNVKAIGGINTYKGRCITGK